MVSGWRAAPLLPSIPSPQHLSSALLALSVAVPGIRLPLAQQLYLNAKLKRQLLCRPSTCCLAGAGGCKVDSFYFWWHFLEFTAHISTSGKPKTRLGAPRRSRLTFHSRHEVGVPVGGGLPSPPTWLPPPPGALAALQSWRPVLCTEPRHPQSVRRGLLVP